MPSDHAAVAPAAPDTGDTVATTPADAGGVGLPAVETLLDDTGTGEVAPAPPPHYRLPTVALPDNVLLKAAVQKLVEQKAQFDALAGNPLLAGLLPAEWLGQGGRALDMVTFVQGVLPFLQPSARGETAAARLPLRHVLGDSGRWGLQDVAEPRSLAWFLASDERASPGTRDPAEAFLVGALGVAWMHEGRSRPGFLRAMGCDTLAARVTMLDYPAPGELALYQVTVQGQPQTWCVHGRRMMRPLQAAWLSVPLLAAYGVAAPVQWPGSYPPVEAVATALGSARLGRAQPEVDLTKVAARVAEAASGETWQPVSLLQLRSWVPRWRFFLATFVGLPAALLVTAALALPGAIEAAAVAALLGFIGGAIGALAAPWVFAKRKDLS